MDLALLRAFAHKVFQEEQLWPLQSLWFTWEAECVLGERLVGSHAPQTACPVPPSAPALPLVGAAGWWQWLLGVCSCSSGCLPPFCRAQCLHLHRGTPPRGGDEDEGSAVGTDIQRKALFVPLKLSYSTQISFGARFLKSHNKQCMPCSDFVVWEMDRR